MPQWLPHWPWYYWAIGTLGTLILLILEGSHRINRELQDALAEQPTLLGDIPIRDAFFQRDEGALENEAWIKIGRELHDLLSQGALKAWGRRVWAGGDAPLEEIPKDYWKDARFTYFFFHDGSDQEVHAEAKVGMHVPDYRDVRLNRRQLLHYWSVPIPRRVPTYNIDAKAAFALVLHKSNWARFWAEDEDQLVARLKEEFRDHLRNGRLTAWGKTHRTLPLRKIEPNEWDTMQLWLDPPFTEDNTYTTTQSLGLGGTTVVPAMFIKLCKEEVLRAYPLRIQKGEA